MTSWRRFGTRALTSILPWDFAGYKVAAAATWMSWVGKAFVEVQLTKPTLYSRVTTRKNLGLSIFEFGTVDDL